MLEAFREGGWAMIPTSFFGLMLLGVALRYARNPESRWIPLQFALGILTLASGMLGFLSGLIRTTTNLWGVDQANVVRIAAVGFGESLHNVALATMVVLFAAMAAVLGTARRALSTA